MAIKSAFEIASIQFDKLGAIFKGKSSFSVNLQGWPICYPRVSKVLSDDKVRLTSPGLMSI